MMSRGSKNELSAVLRPRYGKAKRREKARYYKTECGLPARLLEHRREVYLSAHVQLGKSPPPGPPPAAPAVPVRRLLVRPAAPENGGGEAKQNGQFHHACAGGGYRQLPQCASPLSLGAGQDGRRSPTSLPRNHSG
jgi:hypothetical protein